MSKRGRLAAALSKRFIFADRASWRTGLEKKALSCLKMSSVATRTVQDKEIIHAYLIRTCKYFVDLPKHLVALFLDFLYHRRFSRGETLFGIGDPEEFFLVLSGQVTISRKCSRSDTETKSLQKQTTEAVSACFQGDTYNKHIIEHNARNASLVEARVTATATNKNYQVRLSPGGRQVEEDENASMSLIHQAEEREAVADILLIDFDQMQQRCSHQQLMNVAKTFDVFDGLSHKLLAHLVSNARMHTYKSGDLVQREGVHASAVNLIHSGTMCVQWPVGNEDIAQDKAWAVSTPTSVNNVAVASTIGLQSRMVAGGTKTVVNKKRHTSTDSFQRQNFRKMERPANAKRHMRSLSSSSSTSGSSITTFMNMSKKSNRRRGSMAHSQNQSDNAANTGKNQINSSGMTSAHGIDTGSKLPPAVNLVKLCRGELIGLLEVLHNTPSPYRVVASSRVEVLILPLRLLHLLPRERRDHLEIRSLNMVESWMVRLNEAVQFVANENAHPSDADFKAALTEYRRATQPARMHLAYAKRHQALVQQQKKDGKEHQRWRKKHKKECAVAKQGSGNFAQPASDSNASVSTEDVLALWRSVGVAAQFLTRASTVAATQSTFVATKLVNSLASAHGGGDAARKLRQQRGMNRVSEKLRNILAQHRMQKSINRHLQVATGKVDNTKSNPKQEKSPSGSNSFFLTDLPQTESTGAGIIQTNAKEGLRSGTGINSSTGTNFVIKETNPGQETTKQDLQTLMTQKPNYSTQKLVKAADKAGENNHKLSFTARTAACARSKSQIVTNNVVGEKKSETHSEKNRPTPRLTTTGKHGQQTEAEVRHDQDIDARNKGQWSENENPDSRINVILRRNLQEPLQYSLKQSGNILSLQLDTQNALTPQESAPLIRETSGESQSKDLNSNQISIRDLLQRQRDRQNGYRPRRQRRRHHLYANKHHQQQQQQSRNNKMPTLGEPPESIMHNFTRHENRKGSADDNGYQVSEATDIEPRQRTQVAAVTRETIPIIRVDNRQESVIASKRILTKKMKMNKNGRPPQSKLRTTPTHVIMTPNLPHLLKAQSKNREPLPRKLIKKKSLLHGAFGPQI